MVTGDTLAMHIAIGLKVPVLVMLGPTCHQEIELYGRGAKIVSDFDCSPCYLSVCPKQVTCMDAISVDAVFESVAELLRSRSSELANIRDIFGSRTWTRQARSVELPESQVCLFAQS